MNGRYMRELPLDEYTAAVAAPPRPRARRAPARRLRDRPGESADAGRGLAADPLPLRAAGRRREGLAEGDEGRGAGALLEAAREALAARRALRAERDRGGAGAAARARSGSSRASSTSRSGSRSPARTVSPGIFESLAALGREQALERIDAALERLVRGSTKPRRTDRWRDRTHSRRRPAKPSVLCCRWVCGASPHAADQDRHATARSQGPMPCAAKPQRRRAAPGSRLAEAFEAVERFPVLIESRERVMQAATAETARVGEIVEAVEADVALTIAVLRFANRGGRVAGGVASIPRGGRGAEALRRAGDRRHRRRSSTSSSPTAAGSCGPSASASTPSPPSTPPTGSAARSAGPNATSSPSRRSCTTSAGS